MELNQILLLFIILVPLVFVFIGRLRMDLAALIMAVALGVLQFAGLGMLGSAHTPADALKVLAGFSQSVIIILISLFILTRGLEKSGLTRALARQIVRWGGGKPGRLILLFASVTAFLSLFMNNLAAGALILPGALEVARQTGVKPSKLLIPVAYGSLLGGSATYFTTANMIMSDLLRAAQPPQTGLHILDFTPVGGLIAVAGILFLWLLGDRLLPNRELTDEQKFVRRNGLELGTLYQIPERLWQGTLNADSPLMGSNLADTQIGERSGVAVAAIRRGSRKLLPPSLELRLMSQDCLILIGREEKVRELESLGLQISPLVDRNVFTTGELMLSEVILAPHSTWEGKTLKSLDFRRHYGVTVIALKRLTRSYRTEVGDLPLSMGDSLLVVGTENETRSLGAVPDLILVEADRHNQKIDPRRAVFSVAIIVAAIVASIAGVPVYLGFLCAAVLMLVSGILPVEEAYGAVEWQAVFLIAGMYVVSISMVQTGLAGLLGKQMLSVVTTLGPLGLAGGAYVLTALLTQFMGGQVTAMVTGPIVISAAISMGVNPQAVAVATAIGCSASFFTPMAHPVNILMIAPANYQFKDFLRVGWLLTLICFVVLLVGLSIFWHL